VISGALHSIRRWPYGVRAQACPAASGAGRSKRRRRWTRRKEENEEKRKKEEELYLCQNLDTLTWQVGK